MLTKSQQTYWVAMFSRTGYELACIIERLQIMPHKIICNKDKNNDTTCKELLDIIKKNKIEIAYTSKNPTMEEYHSDLSVVTHFHAITLHGWMRIVPPDVCSKYKMYNGHPGLITKYPELKGKDPQQKAFNLKYEEIGTVIHRVTSELDGGEILAEASIGNTYNTIGSLSDSLRDLSIILWSDFLKYEIL